MQISFSRQDSRSQPRKLSLSRETLRQLTDTELRLVGGGGVSSVSANPSGGRLSVSTGASTSASSGTSVISSGTSVISGH